MLRGLWFSEEICFPVDRLRGGRRAGAAGGAGAAGAVAAVAPADGRGDGLAAALVVVLRLRLRLRRRGGRQQLRHLGRLLVRHRHLDDRRT